MTTLYFLGRTPDGDESGPYPASEDLYDGCLWCVDPDEPEPVPLVLAHIDNEVEAAAVLAILESRERLREACQQALPVLECAVSAGCDDIETATHALQNHTTLVMLRAALALCSPPENAGQ